MVISLLSRENKSKRLRDHKRKWRKDNTKREDTEFMLDPDSLNQTLWNCRENQNSPETIDNKPNQMVVLINILLFFNHISLKRLLKEWKKRTLLFFRLRWLLPKDKLKLLLIIFTILVKHLINTHIKSERLIL